MLTRPCVESSLKTGLTEDRRSGGAASEERGEKEARSAQTRITDGPLYSEPYKKIGSRGQKERKQPNSRLPRSNKSAVGPNERGDFES